MIRNIFLTILLALLFFSSGAQYAQNIKSVGHIQPVSNSKPRVLWWWFADNIRREDVNEQLIWLKEKNIGGVMIFFLYPLNKIKKDTLHYAPRYEFLGEDFTNICIYTKHKCDSMGLSCNFLFGTGWPFGGSFVSKEDAALTRTNYGVKPMQTFSVSWEWPKKGYVIDHLSQKALDNYFANVSKAFIPALRGNKTFLECDSWEIAEFEPVWTDGFDKLFKKEYGYDIVPYVSNFKPTDKKDTMLLKMTPYISKLYDLNDYALYDVRYDYYKLVSKLIINNFYNHYTQLCNSIGSGSIVECNGTPADIIDAYSSVDIPMTESMLYEPNYSKIPASAACLSGKKILASETFTCAYGFREKFGYQEQIADMKLIADAMFANGTNQIYWHGYPLNPKGVDTVKYYATVDVSPKSKLMSGFKEFNAYMEIVSDIMQKGKTYSDIAVYLPMEDRWAEGIYPQDFMNKLKPEERFWHFSKYQMRYEYFPKELDGYPMLWINSSYLKQAKYEKGLLKAGDATFKMLYINANYLPYETLVSLVELAKSGLPVYLNHDPKEPGRNKHKSYNNKLMELKSYKNVSTVFKEIFKSKPLIEGEDLPEFWVRKDKDYMYIFFANPKSKELKYPLKYGQSLQAKNVPIKITINYGGKSIPRYLVFKPYQSLMLRIDNNFNYSFLDINFVPPVPQTSE